MTTMTLPKHLTTPEGQIKPLKRLGYDAAEIATTIADKFEISPTAAWTLIDRTEVR